MTVPLIVLAFFSVFVGLIGIPHAFPALFGSHANINVFEHWLEPVIAHVPATPAAGEASAHAVGGEEAHGAVNPMEYVLIILSLAVAAAGIYLGRLFYLKRPDLPRIWGERLRPLYTLSFNKWYWDYLLDVKGVEAGKAVNNALWKADANVVDGGVNGAGWLTRWGAKISNAWDKYVVDLAVNATAKVTYWSSFIFRAAQTGHWQNYAFVFAAGLFVILALYLFPAVVLTYRALRGN